MSFKDKDDIPIENGSNIGYLGGYQVKKLINEKINCKIS